MPVVLCSLFCDTNRTTDYKDIAMNNNDQLYHTLLGLYRDDDGHFSHEILFGGFEKIVVTEEFEAYRGALAYDGNLYRLVVIETDADSGQDAIDARVDALNEEYFYINQAAKSIARRLKAIQAAKSSH